ncbi:MAG TPA: class I SAM-dependent methyltransferase [Opitutaceae bacterium]|nr:class I SAM-dependent methyltransferase [Opitutaceae bacterium]
MNFYRRSDLQPRELERLAQYDREILDLVGPDYPFPVRMRDWELLRVLDAMAGLPANARILDTGAFNTYLGLHLSRRHPQVTVSDLLRARARKSLLRRLGLAPRKPTEAGYFTWVGLMRRHGLQVKNLDLTNTGLPDASFDCIVSLSVIEHIPAVEQALVEMYRLLAPGGRLLVTTDCSREPRPFADGVRYFSVAELQRLFAGYPVTSARSEPDFAPENWCYGGQVPVVTCFVEITKPR